MAVWLVLLAVVIGGAGVGGTLMFGQREAGGETPVAATKTVDGPGQFAPPNRPKELPQRAVQWWAPGWRERDELLLRSVKFCKEAWERRDEITRRVLPKLPPPAPPGKVETDVAAKPTSKTLHQVNLPRFIDGDPPPGGFRLVDITSEFGFRPGEAVQLRLLVSDPLKQLVVDSAANVITVQARVGKVNEAPRTLEFICFSLDGVVVKSELKCGREERKNTAVWNALANAVLEVKQGSDIRHIALREVAGGKDRIQPDGRGRLRKLIEWIDPANPPANKTLFLRSAALERETEVEVEVEVRRRQKGDKPPPPATDPMVIRIPQRRITFAVEAQIGRSSKCELSPTCLISGEELKKAVEKQLPESVIISVTQKRLITKLTVETLPGGAPAYPLSFINTKGEEVAPDTVEIKFLELFQVIENVEVPVFRIDRRSKAPSATAQMKENDAK
jgi:hypothetical protein